MNSELIFRFAELDDVASIVELVESAYRGDASRCGWTTEADLIDGHRIDATDIPPLLTTDGSIVILAERNGALVSSCHLESRESYAYFGLFAVNPGEQGTGIGKTVLAEAERVARETLGANELHMKVLIQRPDLIAWYERRGYSRTGSFSPFPYGDTGVGIPRRDDLEFEILIKQL